MVSASTSRADSRNAVAQIHLPWLDHLGSRIMGNNTGHFAYTPLKFNIADVAVENGWLEILMFKEQVTCGILHHSYPQKWKRSILI